MSAQQSCLFAGALFGATGVVLGAWGAHGLAAFTGDTDTGAWDTAVLYQLIHALGLLLIGGLLLPQRQSAPLTWAGYLMMAGIVLFSGSIYVLVLGGPRWVGPITPLGGVSFIAAWSLLVVTAWRWPHDQTHQ